MKKKILLGLLVLIGLFIVTGCAVDSAKKETFFDLKYSVPNNYKSDLDFGSDENKTKNYIFGEYDGSISINFQKGKDYSEVENEYYNEHTEKEINGTKWRVMDNDDLGVKSKFYYTVYNNNLYFIELNGIDKYQEEMNDFMENTSFK